ncbi:hypothetical protein MTP99_017934 [Tenebrio molitor]|nr:hypothetical protein MTP99_017934 [Tenebrio molitor]
MLSHSAWPHRLSPSTTILRTSLTHAQSEESGIEPGHIATITGSLASFPDHDPDHYDTDHTDLASESDEAELRRVLLRDQWRQFFDKYDPEGFGEIPWSDLMTAMSDPEFRHRVGTGKREILLEKARVATTPAITFQDFVNVIGALSQTRYSHFVSLSPRHRCPSSVPIGTIAHIQLAYQYGAIAQDSKYLLPVSTPEYFHAHKDENSDLTKVYQFCIVLEGSETSELADEVATAGAPEDPDYENGARECGPNVHNSDSTRDTQI